MDIRMVWGWIMATLMAAATITATHTAAAVVVAVIMATRMAIMAAIMVIRMHTADMIMAIGPVSILTIALFKHLTPSPLTPQHPSMSIAT